MRTKEEVREILGLAHLPDDEFMQLLVAAGEEETVTCVCPVKDGEYSPDDLRAELQTAIDA